MKCLYCNSQLDVSDKFCTNCGQSINATTSSSVEKPSNTKKILLSIGGVLAFIVAFAVVRALVSSSFNTPSTTSNTSNESIAVPPNLTVSQNSEWAEFNSISGQFKILMPKYPKHETSTQEIPDSGITFSQDTYEVEEVDGTYYLVGLSEYPSSVDTSDPKTNLSGTLNGLLNSNPDNKLVSSKIAYFDAYSALDYEITNTAESVSMKGRAVLEGHKMYILMVLYPNGTNKTLEYNKFINSFALLD